MDTNTTDFTSLGNNIKIGNLTEDLTTFMEMVEEYMAFKVALQINFYWFPILAPIGLVGNTLSFLVMIQPNNKKISTCIYMAAISVNDNIMMCLALHNWLGSAKPIFEWHVVQCKTVTFLTALVKQNSRYQILAMTVDKYIAIKWPHRAAIYSTPKKAKLTLLGVLIFSLIYNTRHIFMSSLVGGKCRGYAHGGLIAEVLTWITFIVNGIIPISMLIYMNFVIIQTVKNSSKMFESTSQFKRESHTNMGMDKRQKKMKNVESQLTIMLLLVTILYLVLQIPTYIRNIYVKFIILNTPSKYVSSILSPKVCGQLSPENCMKIKEMEPRGGYVPGGSLGSANVNDLTKAYLIQQSHTGSDTGFSPLDPPVCKFHFVPLQFKLNFLFQKKTTLFATFSTLWGAGLVTVMLCNLNLPC